MASDGTGGENDASGAENEGESGDNTDEDGWLRTGRCLCVRGKDGKPIEHFLTDVPADPRCKACVRAKQRRAAARSAADKKESPSTKDVPDALGLVHLD